MECGSIEEQIEQISMIVKSSRLTRKDLPSATEGLSSDDSDNTAKSKIRILEFMP